MQGEREEPQDGQAAGSADPPPPVSAGNGSGGAGGGVDEVLREFQEYCSARADAHTRTARYRTLRNTWLAILAVVLSAILALPLLGTAAITLWVQWVAGLLALPSTVAAGAQKVFNGTEKVGKDAKASTPG